MNMSNSKNSLVKGCRLLLVSCWLMLSVLTVSAGKPAKDSLQILWIGNSYTIYNDLPSMVTRLAAEQGLKLAATRFLKGGEHLSGHYANPALIKALKKGGWDYVVLQEFSTGPAQSTREVIADTYHYAHLLDSLAHDGSPSCHVIFYMTWGHKAGNAHNKSQLDPAYPLDENYTDFQAHLRLSYLEMTYDNKAWCAPVGIAWQDIRTHHPDINLYAPDGYHPSLAGSYLAAHTFVATLLRKRYTTRQYYNLLAPRANILCKAAQNAVLNNKKLLFY